MSSLLPPNATPTELAIEASIARIAEVPVPVGNLWNPATCPGSLLPWLAWALSVDEWNAAWDEATQRAVVAASIPAHMKKGTVWALKQALNAAGYPDTTWDAWYRHGGDPYTGIVHVHIYHEGIEDETWARIIRLINQYKNVRSHIELRLYLAVKSPLRLATFLQSGEEVTVWPWNTPDIAASGSLYLAVGSQSVETVTIYPQ